MDTTQIESSQNYTFFDSIQPVIIECYKLEYIGIFSSCLFVLSLSVNVTHILVLVKNKRLLTPVNFVVLSLTVVNLVGTLIEIPLVTLNAFNCKNLFGKFGCHVGAFMMYFIGCLNVYLLMAISIQRYVISLKLEKVSKKLNYKQVIHIIYICFFVSLFWAAVPIFGWSYYSYEGLMITCSVEWHSRELNVISYNIAMFVFVFIIPIVSFLFTNIKILLTIKKNNKNFVKYRLSSKTIRKRLNRQKEITSMIIISFVCYTISWSPYAIVCICRAFFDECTVSQLMATLPAYFAKLSLVWPALVNLLTNKRIRMSLRGQESSTKTFIQRTSDLN